MKQLFLLTRAYLLVIIVNHSILARLLDIVFFECIIEQLMIHGFYVLIVIRNVIFCSFLIDILSDEITVVMCGRGFADHSADGSFQHLVLPHFYSFLFCYSCQE